MIQSVSLPFSISVCIATVFSDNLSMLDAYDGYLCQFVYLNYQSSKTRCVKQLIVTPTGACSVEQQHVTALLYRPGAEAG